MLESAIDALSFRQLFNDAVAVSIAGDGNNKIMEQIVSLAKEKGLDILAAFDNDKGGDVASKALTEYASLKGVVILQRRPEYGKDYNEQLCFNTFRTFA